ncbi:hypothetical protein OM076_27310 [Solirubrobacter ginsenosidimutans]|uniref:Uncharacterized protein n=1 Tax=Solirubrobacter ginsenosidimutans TaxID=490573 RepID=A0A9X3S5B8_9ACTN|nr:hypothetical protein [Solirubrobacter ginsenosidimutans]MDA0164011.1 hypothetical protein [Solirubrobacter ginsenosidimutans]
MTATEPPELSSSPPKPGKPWVWIGLSAVLLVVAVGLGIWAIGLRQDLDDANQQADVQTEQVADTSDDLSQQVDELTAAVNDTSDRLDQAIADGQASADALRQKAADAGQGTDDASQQAADAQQEAQDAIAALDTRLTDLAGQIKAKLADLKAAAEPDATQADATPEPTQTAEPEATEATEAAQEAKPAEPDATEAEEKAKSGEPEKTDPADEDGGG